MLNVSLVSRVRQRIPVPELARDGLLQPFARRGAMEVRVGVNCTMIQSSAEET